MGMWFTKQPSGFRGWIAVVRASGQLRTGLVAGDFAVTVVAPGDGANATPSMTESSQKAGVYYFDILTAFITANGIGEYGVVIEVDTIAGPSGAPQVRTAISEVMRVTARNFDDLAQPGDAMALTAGERTSLAAIVWSDPIAKLLLGLAGKHQRIFPVTFDAFGNMDEGFMRIYDTKIDADGDTNHIAQIELTGEFDGLNKPKTDVGLKQVLLP